MGQQPAQEEEVMIIEDSQSDLNISFEILLSEEEYVEYSASQSPENGTKSEACSSIRKRKNSNSTIILLEESDDSAALPSFRDEGEVEIVG